MFTGMCSSLVAHPIQSQQLGFESQHPSKCTYGQSFSSFDPQTVLYEMEFLKVYNPERSTGTCDKKSSKKVYINNFIFLFP